MIISLSHMDLDGIGCQIVINHNLKQVEYLNCNYDKIEEYINTLEDIISRNKVSDVYITDLSFNSQQMMMLNSLSLRQPKINFIVIDHHPQTKECGVLLTSPNTTLVYSDEKSATLLVYEYFDKNPTKLGKLTNTINAFDIWLMESPYFIKGMELNDLFWEYKIKRFFNTFSNALDTEKIKKDIDTIRDKKDKYFVTLKNKGLIFEDSDSVLSFSDYYMSWVQIKYPDKKFYINSTTNGRIQIRLGSWTTPELSDEIKANIIKNIPKQRVITFGGHHRAFSLQHEGKYDSNEITSYLQTIYTIIKDKIC